MWRLEGTLENTFKLHTGGAVLALVALPDNEHALSASADKTVKLFSVPSLALFGPPGFILRTFKHHLWSKAPVNNSVHCLALLPDGLRFVSGSDDGTACIVYHGLAPTKV